MHRLAELSKPAKSNLRDMVGLYPTYLHQYPVSVYDKNKSIN